MLLTVRRVRPAGRRLLFVALLTMAVVVVGCTGSSEPTPTVAIPPTSTPVPPVDTIAVPDSSPVATPVNGGDISPELAALLLEIDRSVATIRGIPVADPVPFMFLNEAELGEWVREEFDDPELIEEIGNSGELYKLLGLIAPDQDLLDKYFALLDAQVLGAYDPEDEEFVVLQKGDTFGPSQEFTYAHEYVHRLQDAKFSLDELTERYSESSDQALAFSALVEGDATSTQQTYGLRNLSIGELTQILTESQGALDTANEAPFILRRGLEFPYVEGLAFVSKITANDGIAGVNNAFAQPPDSTEQVLHFEKYVEREMPHDVSLGDAVFTAGGAAEPGWELVDDDVLGEFFLKAWLQGLGAAESDASLAAAGWGGDAINLIKSDDGDFGFVAKVTWDDGENDALEFNLVLNALLENADQFAELELNGPPEISAYESGAGVIATSYATDSDGNRFTAIAAAPTLGEAMALLLNIVSS